ncbi:aryl hydrocarbon receptor 2 isoform X2 [Pristis pectinata]|uniref:aryl hydrocarbon receptor 2 isoform X2 n=1 Tax=Pristis pectinata TaxID=685728 RepID=UPI00223DE535|nr:aryl hydrocarbon receptor 2 isoform X2 [Pristis pectinata]
MLSSGGIYAVKKRKKPVQKSPKPSPIDGVKSNPSKRHRDRLNCELDKLTSLLPFTEDVRARLDKLSVLRLSVGYLKAKSFFNASMKKNKASWMPDKLANFQENEQQSALENMPVFSEGELLLEALNGFILVVTAEGYVFYTSSTIQDYLGFHQSDVVHQSVFELIHTDDRPLFRRQLHWALNPAACQESNPHADTIPESNSLCPNVVAYDPLQLPPENSSFMERNFICRFRCLLDNSSGFLTLNFQGRLRFLHGQNKRAEDGTPIPPQLALFALATPLQPPSILEVRTKTLIFQTKHKLDFTPLACDTKGKFVLGYTETELCMRGTGYQFIHAADMMYCADNHVRMIKTGESGMTVFRLLTKQSSWVWVQANARLVYRGGRPDSIICKQRALTNEEGEEHLRKRSSGLHFSFATGEAVLYENNLFHLDPSLAKGKSFKVKKPSNGENSLEQKNGIDPGSLLGALMTQNISAYVSHHESQFNLDSVYTDDFAVLSVPGDFRQLVSGGKNSSKQQETLPVQGDPLAAIMDILSDKNADENDLCNTLQNLDVDVEPAELEQWEEALMKMDSSPPITDDLNEIFTTGFILSCVQDMLSKDSSKANEFPHVGLDCTEGNLIEPAQQNPFGSMEQKPFGFNMQNPAMSGCQSSVMAGAQNPVMAGAQNPVMAGAQNPVMAGAQNPVMIGGQNPVMIGGQNPVMAGGQNPVMAGAQNPVMAGAQNLVMAGAQNPVVPIPQNTLIPACQTSIMSCPQNPQMPACQTPVLPTPQKAIVSQPHNVTLFGPPNACAPNQHNNAQPGNRIPLGPFPQNFLGMNLGCPLASDTPSPISYSPQKLCRSAAQKMSSGVPVTMQQKHMGNISPIQTLQRDLQQSLQQRPEYLGVNGQQERHFVNATQQQVPQWPSMQNEQRVSMQPYAAQDPMHQLMPQSSCRLGQDSEDKASATAYSDQSNVDQLLYSCSVAVDQGTSVNQLPMGASPSYMFASCEYQSCAPIARNGLSFPGIGSTAPIPAYSKIKISPNHSPLRPTCYYENEPANSIVGSSVMSNGELNTYQSSCQFEPNFTHLSENSICEIPTGHVPWNYNNQFKGEALN